MSRIAVVGLILATLVGCGPSASVRLHQPRLDQAQQDLALRSNSAVYAVSAEGVARYRLAYPLPGATVGRNYFMYLRLSAKGGRYEIGSPLPDGGFAGGFLIQRTGRSKGLTEFVGGEIRVSGAGLGSSAMRSGSFRLKCADGSTATGDFRAGRDDLELRDFEQRDYPADVAALQRIKTQPANAP